MSKPRRPNPRPIARTLALQGLFLLDVQGETGLEAARNWITESAAQPVPADRFRLLIESTAEAAVRKADIPGAGTVELDVPPGAPPAPHLQPGHFTATWTGNLPAGEGEWYFSATGRGRIRMTVAEKVVLDTTGDGVFEAMSGPVMLPAGPVAAEVRFLAPKTGEARLKVVRIDGAVLAYATRLLTGAWRKRGESDARIARCSEHWDLARLAVADRNILRLALFEMTEVPDVPPKVAVNEAIELAKTFGAAESPRFVNGILDNVLRQGAGGSRPADGPKS